MQVASHQKMRSCFEDSDRVKDTNGRRSRMNQVEWIFHACGCREPHRIFGPERIKTKQREFYQAKRCGDCEEAQNKKLYGPLRPTEQPTQ